METNKLPNMTLDELFKKFESSPIGLSEEVANNLINEHGKNALPEHHKEKILVLLIRQFKSPLILLLVIAAILSASLGDHIDALIILSILILSNTLQFWQEYQASDAVQKLLKMVQIKVNTLRDRIVVDIPIGQIVPGDVVVLNAGDLVPGDCALFDVKDLFIDEASLTGETFPAEKSSAKGSEIIDSYSSMGFFGTHVISGEANGLIIETGRNTAFGKVANALDKNSQLTSFEKGINKFSLMLMEMTFIFLTSVFFINIFFQKPLIGSFLFALAIAVGMTPQLLPATLSMTLAIGAKRLAQKKVIVKRLNAIQNLGSMTVFCSDKTGTLTEGQMVLQGFVGPDGNEKKKVLEYAALNAQFQTGFNNPIDQAILNRSCVRSDKYIKDDEIPYDFNRKILTVALTRDDQSFLISKGAFSNLLGRCQRIEISDGSVIKLDEDNSLKLTQMFKDLSSKGLRVISVAYKTMKIKKLVSKSDEEDLIFLGFLTFNDPLKKGVAESLKKLQEQGIKIKIISGDSRFTVEHLTKEIGLINSKMLTGKEISELPEHALTQRALQTDVFSEVDPAQKEYIIRSLQRGGETVGFLGDGINDAPALYKADVGISVEGAVDIAKSAASIVLLEKDLDILSEGISEGRRIFSNSMKYIFITTSANFGNMFSMAAASLFLPFLPLLPKQILFNNLLTSVPSLSIGTDSVDKELIEKPRKWDIHFIKKFMFFFGLHSSIFDMLTFYLLHWHLKLSPEAFRTGWFLESSLSQILILLVIRTPKPFYKSKPSIILMTISISILVFTFIATLLVHNQLLDFVALSTNTVFYLIMIVAIYIFTAELVKHWFYRKWPI